MQTGRSKTPRQGVVVALLVCRVLGRTSTAVGNLTTLFFYKPDVKFKNLKIWAYLIKTAMTEKLSMELDIPVILTPIPGY